MTRWVAYRFIFKSSSLTTMRKKWKPEAKSQSLTWKAEAHATKVRNRANFIMFFSKWPMLCLWLNHRRSKVYLYLATQGSRVIHSLLRRRARMHAVSSQSCRVDRCRLPCLLRTHIILLLLLLHTTTTTITTSFFAWGSIIVCSTWCGSSNRIIIFNLEKQLAEQQ